MINTFKNVNKVLNNNERRRFVYIFISVLIMAIIEVAGVASILPFMAVISNPKVVETNKYLKLFYNMYNFENIREYLFFLGVIIFIFLVLSNVFKAITTYQMTRYDNDLYASISKRLMAKYLVETYQFYLNKNTSDLGTNILAEARNVINSVVSPALQVLANSMVSVLIIVLLMLFDPTLGITIALVLGGAYTSVYYLVRGRLDEIGIGQVYANRHRFKAVVEALSGIKETIILGKEKYFLDEFSVHANRHAKLNALAGVISKLPRYALETLSFGGILLIVLIKIGGKEEYGHIVPILALYAFSGYRLLPALQQVFSGITMIRSNNAALNIISEDLHGFKETEVLRRIANRCSLTKLPFENTIEIKNLSFAYSGRKSKAISNVDVTIEKNSMIGFVGSTGSGKTTFVDVLIGLLEPAGGKIVVDGTVVDSSNLAHWQRNIGYVPQMIFLTDDTVSKNIAFGVPNDQIDMVAVKKAAEMANIDKFIEEEMPEKYDTFIGEKGVRISGGQRQRIGIARALYHNPEVIVFDEATSALDGQTEAHIVESINRLAGNKTIIMIAHRISTLKNCSKIFIMDKGKVAGQGNYEEIVRYLEAKPENTKVKNVRK